MAHLYLGTLMARLRYALRPVVLIAGTLMSLAMSDATDTHDPQEQHLKVRFDQPVDQEDIDRISSVLFSEKSYGVTSVTSDVATRTMVVDFTAEPDMSRTIFDVFRKLGYRVSYAH